MLFGQPDACIANLKFYPTIFISQPDLHASLFGVAQSIINQVDDQLFQKKRVCLQNNQRLCFHLQAEPFFSCLRLVDMGYSLDQFCQINLLCFQFLWLFLQFRQPGQIFDEPVKTLDISLDNFKIGLPFGAEAFLFQCLQETTDSG